MYNFNNYGPLTNWTSLFFLPLLVPALIWSFVWKGLALYRSARNGQKGWFILLLVVNTVGILEIIYLLFFSKTKEKK